MSAVSNILIPASRQISTRRRASAASLAPQAWKNSPLPPNVPAPKLRTGTLKPDAPSLRNSTLSLLKSVICMVVLCGIETPRSHLVPEKEIDIDHVCALLKYNYDHGKHYGVVVVAEGAHLPEVG